jgi:ABC transport system ATP-binding/permease protein
MNVLTADKLSMSYSDKSLFEDLSISLAKGEKIAIIAANGTGKSTLLKILAGEEIPDEGTVVFRKGIRLGYLEQSPDLNNSLSVIDAILDKNHPVMALLIEYELLLVHGNSDDIKFQNLLVKIDNENAWGLEAKIREVLSKLGINDIDKKISELSGGQRKRVVLAKMLLEDKDILILDEPTNHLDLDMIEWLEKYLKKLNRSVIIVSHDRYFIDSICSSILELANGTIYKYKGNYANFLEKRNSRIESSNTEIKKYKNLYRKELEWMKRQPKARGTKQKARVNSFDGIKEKAFSGEIENKTAITMQMNRMGNKILELEYVCKSYDDLLLLDNFSHIFKKKEKVGIVGKNGVGKTTLLKMITGHVKPDKGKVRIGETISIGYFSQDGMNLDDDKLVIDAIRDVAEYIDTGDGSYMSAKKLLTHFNFDGKKQFQKISHLSGGEKKRLYLLTILVNNPNFLILDEPTNDLDIETLNIFEEFLSGYQGCVLLVTHDRYFMDKLVDHIFVFEGNGIIKDINGNYSDYRADKLTSSVKTVVENSDSSKISNQKNKSPRSGLTFKEKRELEEAELEIDKLESIKASLMNKLSGTESDHTLINTWSVELNEAEEKINELTSRWMELEEKKKN